VVSSLILYGTFKCNHLHISGEEGLFIEGLLQVKKGGANPALKKEKEGRVKLLSYKQHTPTGSAFQGPPGLLKI